MKDKNKSPELRFAAFKGDWVEKKFEKVFRGIRNNSLSRDKLNYKSGKAKNIHYGDILVKFGEIVDVQKQQLPFITGDDDAENLRGSELINGDVILADAAEDEIVGKCIEIQNINTEVIHSGLHTIAVRPLQKFAPKYLGYYLNSSSYHDQLIRLMQGTKVLSISKTAIQDTGVRYPSNEEEQNKISEYITEINELITKHQKKQNRLVTLKKSMLEKMFPNEGQAVPEIRFKGFGGDWVEKKLNQIATYQSSSLTVGDALQNGKYELYDANSLIGFTNEETLSEVYITIIKDGSGVGRLRVLPKNTGFIATLGAILPNKGIDITFLLCCLLNTDFNSHIMGATIPHVYFSSYGEVVYRIPTTEEQLKIGEYFKNLDQLIFKHNKQLKKLNNFKQSLSEKMFV